MRLHLAWLQALDGTSFWCSNCGDGGGLDDDDLLLVCDSEVCGRAHHLSCSSLELMRLDFWKCEMCVITERIVRRRGRSASDAAVLNGLHRRAAVVADGETVDKQPQLQGRGKGRKEGQGDRL